MPMSHPVALTLAPVMVWPLVAIMAAVRPVEPAAVHVAAKAGVDVPTAATTKAPPARAATQMARPATCRAVRAYRWMDMGNLLCAGSADARASASGKPTFVRRQTMPSDRPRVGVVDKAASVQDRARVQREAERREGFSSALPRDSQNSVREPPTGG